MKKFLRLIVISALLLGIFIPVLDYYYNQQETVFISKAQESRDRNINELLDLAKEAFYDGNYQGAEHYYQEVIKEAPFNLESRRNLAIIYNDQNNLKAENQTLLKTAILSNQSQDYLKLAVNFYELNNNLASNYILENKVDNEFAEKSFLFQKYHYLIKNHLELKNYETVENYLMKITNLNINKADVSLLTAELNKNRSNFKQAFNNYQKAYQENRTQTYLFKNMAQMLEKSEEEIRAYDYWQKTLAYGWFKELAYQKINLYQEKYPELKPEEKKRRKT